MRYATASTKGLNRLVTGLSAVHSGFWLGMLDAASLDATTAAYYGASDQFLADDHNLRGLAPWESEIIARHTKPSSRVLVPSAGGGREILALADMGYDATGYDPTPELVDIGHRLIRDTGSKARLLLSHRNTIAEGLDPPYDWALFGWGSVSHIQGRDNRIATFRSIRDVLAPNGVFIVSFLPRQENSPRYNLVYKVARTVRDLRRSKDTVELGDTIDGSFDHHFTFPEILRELATAGFTELARAEQPYPHIVCART